VTATGGEPFLEREILLRFVRLCNGYGLGWEIETNGYWGCGNKSEEFIKEISEFGHGVLSISVDKFHQEHIPLETTKRSAKLASKYGLDVRINVCMMRDKESWNIIREIAHWKYPLDVSSVVTLGRAKTLENEAFFEQRPNYGCDSVGSPYVMLDGTVILCCGAPLRSVLSSGSALVIGRTSDDIEVELNKHERPYVQALHEFGPIQTARWMWMNDLFPEFPRLLNLGLNYCEVCAYISRLPLLISIIESKSLDQFKSETDINENFSMYFPDQPITLKEGCEYITFKDIPNDKTPNRETFQTCGILALPSNELYELVLLDNLALKVVESIADPKGALDFFLKLTKQDKSDLEFVRSAHIISRLRNIGAIVPIVKGE
jgi:hypothetical protein